MLGVGETGEKLHGACRVSKGTQPWGLGCLHGSPDCTAPKPSHGGELSTLSCAAWTKAGALQFLEGEAGSKGTDPASHAPGLGLHFPEAGDQGKPKLAGD